MPEKPVTHALDHRPGGFDPSPTGPTHLVGDPGEPPFMNGSNAPPTATVPDPAPMQFRLSVGSPNVLLYDWTTKPPTVLGIETHTDHQVEIAGDVTGVNPGDTVFVLPIEMRHPDDRPCHAHDDAGNYVPCRLLSTGEFLYGVA